MTRAVCPGSFDPVTHGHLDVIERTARVIDQVVVAVGTNMAKNALFTPDERVEMLTEECAQWSNVEVTLFRGLLVDFCVANDIDIISNRSNEWIGYPTQKPLTLLKRVIETSSDKGAVVLDAFCGCGTALVAAQTLHRQWIGIDQSPTACRVMAKRLRDDCHLPESDALWKTGRGFIVRDLPWSEEKLRRIPPFEFENWAVIALGGAKNAVQVMSEAKASPIITAFTTRSASRYMPTSDSWCGSKAPPMAG